MKIVVFSDLHGNYQATKVLLEDIKKNNYDKVICLGDNIGLGPKSKETLELVLNSGVDIVLGNHELYYINGIEELEGKVPEGELEHHKWVHDCIKDIPKERLNYPLSEEIDVDGKKLLFQHYMLSNESTYPFVRALIDEMDVIEDYSEHMDCDYMFVGHEHRGFEVNKNGKHILCIGSSGCVKGNKTFYVVIDTNNGNLIITKKEIEFDREGFVKDVKAYKYPDQDFVAKVLLGIDDI